MKQEAWVTSAVEDGSVDKAIILAGSLRRARTAKTLVVMTTSAVSEKLRETLKDAFDLVLLLEQNKPNGMSLEDYAKVEAFSLLSFKKCVYLSPNTLVLKNCDEIFDEYSCFAVGENVDFSVFVFVPSLESRALRKTAHNLMESSGTKVGDLSYPFSEYLRRNSSEIGTLDSKFNVALNVNGNSRQSFFPTPCIVNFMDAHPLEVYNKTSGGLGPVEQLATEYCWRIFKEDVEKSPMNIKRIPGQEQYANEPIAIVGMSFRLPGGNNVDEFWSLLKEGRNAVVPLPLDRWTKTRSHLHCKNRKVEAGFLNVPIDEVDAKFFGLSPKDAEFLDPQQRLLLEVTWEALEDAMIDPSTLKGTQAGVFVGSWVHDYKDIVNSSVDFDYFRTYMGNSIGSSAARISHFLETTGPSIATESGCSSAIAAVNLACKSLRNGDSSLAIAAGVNLLLHPFESNLMDYVLSPDYRCKTFDARANGFARAEACTVLLLKRLSNAVRDSNQIWGLIRGSALTQEGVSKSLGTPTVHCESLAMELALKDGGVDPKDVSYVEAHGTGTSVGDPLEIKAIQKAYSKQRSEPLIIGSVKTNVGHTEAASGITGIIKVLLSMKHELIPRHLNLNTLNPNIDLDTIPAQIPTTSIPWLRKDGKRRIAGVSSFGISGTDGHAIIEEPPQIYLPRPEIANDRPLHIMKISAKSIESLNELIKRYEKLFKEKVTQNEDTEREFASLAYSANTGRATFNHRAVIISKNFAQASKILKEKSFGQTEIHSTGSKLCFLFTGQGSQYPNMAKQLYKSSPVFRDNFDMCDNVLKKRHNIFIKPILWNSVENNGDLNRSLFSQTSIFVVEYCLLKLWESWGVKPDYVMGHSLGEFAAAVAAGALGFEDAIMLVAERSRLIDSLPEGKMLVIKADRMTVERAISELQQIQPGFWVDYAALNSPEQTVVAGAEKMIEDLSTFCRGKGLKTIVLAATHAFHSRHMEPILDSYREVALSVKKLGVRADLPKYVSGVEGKVVDVKTLDSDYWVKHTREKVKYMEVCDAVKREGVTLFLEIGPHPVLSALTAMNLEGVPVACLPSIRRNEDDWTTMLNSLSKLYLSEWKGEINWMGFDSCYPRHIVKIPFYPFNRKPIWAVLESKQAQLHPLIGHTIPNASNETIFQNSLTLKNASFVQDHVIGNTIVFPGAGFLEMCLAGGHAAVQGHTAELIKPGRPIFLRSLKITSPFALSESEVYKVQTLLTLRDKEVDGEGDLGYSVSVHRHLNNGDGMQNWMQHASAKFLLSAPMLPSRLVKQVDITTIQSNWGNLDCENFYKTLPGSGLRLGPQFQTLEFGWKSEMGLLASVKVPQMCRSYLIHPVIVDAMLQAIIHWTNEGTLKVVPVPVQVGEFIWIKETKSSKRYVYCSNDENETPYCILIDEFGSPLAYMTAVDFIHTSAKSVEGLIAQKSQAMPQLWEDEWRSSCGPMQGYLTHSSPHKDLNYTEEDLQLFQARNQINDKEHDFYKKLVNFSRQATLKALYELGWNPTAGKYFDVDSLMHSLKIKGNFQQYIQFFLRSLATEECSVLESKGKHENIFQFLVHPPTLEELGHDLELAVNGDEKLRREYQIIAEIGKHLSQILLGEVDVLSILFPNDQTKPSAKQYYSSLAENVESQSCLGKLGKHLTKALRTYSSELHPKLCRPVYRILEIGAGTGTFTAGCLDYLARTRNECDIEYYFTDVTAAFFSSAEKQFENFPGSMVFKIFDMEKDPLEQGFCPGYFDCITAFEVLHIAKDIKKTVKNVRSLLKSGGMILICESVYPDERTTFIFGLLDGYWQFEDRHFRKNHVTLTPKMWEETLAESGFNDITCIPFYNNTQGVITAYGVPTENNFLHRLTPPTNGWIIFGDDQNDFAKELRRKIMNVNRKCFIVSKLEPENFTESTIKNYFQTVLSSVLKDVNCIEGIVYLWSLSPSTRDQTKLSLPFLTITQLVSEFKNPPKTFVVMQGACGVFETGIVVDPSPASLLGFCKSLCNENSSLKTTWLDLDPDKTTTDQVDELFMNLWVDHKLGAAFRDGLRLSPKLAPGKITRNEPLSLPGGCDRFQLLLPKTKLISDLDFTNLDACVIGEDEVEVKVKAMALNFRDVFAVLKPIPLFEKINSVGLDYSGVIVKVGEKVTKVKVGDRVMGMVFNPNLSLPSHYKTGERQVIPLPNNVTFAEGATLPVVFFTAFHCLLDIAKMQQGETVLIHTASGGVGLVAVQLCKYVGANIIATAGSQAKRTYLRNLGIKHVFHSRTTDFKKDVLKVTGGKGVDIVLNSLTGPGFKEASLDVLSRNGRFVEMSKLNVWTEEEVKALRHDVSYEIVDLTSLESQQYERLSKELGNFMRDGFIRPIAYERFDALNIRGALNYLQKAKHIGKIVVIMPEVRLEHSKLITTTPLFNEYSTYLVTGGLGGIGFEVVKWMLNKGAKHIVVVSRSVPKPDVASQIERWNTDGKIVQAFPLDVGNYDDCKLLFEHIKKSERFPPLRGIMHAAGVLHDAVMENQSWDKFSHTFNPKVKGTWNLHDLTKECLLEHFVLFSSIAASFGSPGQTNHSASNAFEDSLAAFRRSNGLPALSVNWGNWGEVGVATEVDLPGVRPISTAQGLLALETFLRTQTSRMAVLNVDSFPHLLKLMPQLKHYIDDFRLIGNVKAKQIMNSDEFWNEIDSSSDQNGKLECLKKFIKAVIRNLLKMEESEPINDQTELQTLGIDSLMMLEMKNGIQNILGGRITLTASVLKDCNNTEMLAEALLNAIMGRQDSENQISHDQLQQLIRDDSNLLPETLSVENMEAKPIDQVETVLLTGATGNLGPYLLQKLTNMPQIQSVYCLVRSSDRFSGLERLTKVLENMELSGIVDMTKVKVIDGDITQDLFGLNDDAYIDMCENVDAVVHSAVKSDHTAKYRKLPKSNAYNVRTVNVLGTVRLLEFAARRKLKHFFHASSMVALTGTGEDGQFSEGWQSVSAFDTMMIGSLGYAISKHISEQLVHQAILRGIPCKAFRFPIVSGDSKTGRVSYEQNHFILRMLACMRIGAIHDMPMPVPTMAVDHCAKISLQIFFNPGAPMDVYNIVPKSLEIEQVLVDVAQTFGISLSVVSYHEFVKRLKADGEKSPMSAFVDMYADEEAEIVDTFKNPTTLLLQKIHGDGINIDTSKLVKYAPDYENIVETTIDTLRRDFTYLKNQGVFEKYNINPLYHK